jgi:hypothetical protein
MANEKYSMSFTTGGLHYHESIKVAELFLELGDWSAVRELVFEKNLLQGRSMSTTKRLFRETSSRLKRLTEDQISILGDGSRQEQNQVLWLAVCKRFRFIHDFAVEVVREKFLRMDMELTREDYNAFFNAKAEWHDELEQLARDTKIKLKQVVFKMMREADLLSRSHTIIPPILTPRVVSVITADSPVYLAIFPISGGH